MAARQEDAQSPGYTPTPGIVQQQQFAQQQALLGQAGASPQIGYSYYPMSQASMTAMLSQVQGGGQRPGCFPMLSSYNMAPNQYAASGAAAAAATGIPFANGGGAAAQQQAIYAYSMMNGGGGGALPNGAAPTPVQFNPLPGAANSSGGPMDRLGRGGDVSPTALRKLSHNAVEVRRRRRISMQLDRLKTMLNRRAARSLSRLGQFRLAHAASCCPPPRPIPSLTPLPPPPPQSQGGQGLASLRSGRATRAPHQEVSLSRVRACGAQSGSHQLMTCDNPTCSPPGPIPKPKPRTRTPYPQH